MTTTTLLQRQSISVSEFRCSAGPDDKPFVEQYRGHSVSYVRKGRRRYFYLLRAVLRFGRLHARTLFKVLFAGSERNPLISREIHG